MLYGRSLRLVLIEFCLWPMSWQPSTPFVLASSVFSLSAHFQSMRLDTISMQFISILSLKVSFMMVSLGKSIGRQLRHLVEEVEFKPLRALCPHQPLCCGSASRYCWTNWHWLVTSFWEFEDVDIDIWVFLLMSQSKRFVWGKAWRKDVKTTCCLIGSCCKSQFLGRWL